MNKEISICKIKADAQEVYRNGDFLCSEAVVYAIRQNIAPEMPKALISAASGFPGGVGGSKCMCGAVTGGVICLGYFFGRTFPTTITDPESQKTIALAYELQDSFKKNHKVLCCHVHLRGKDIEKGEHIEQCIQFTGEMAEATARIIARELDLKIVEQEGAEDEERSQYQTSAL